VTFTQRFGSALLLNFDFHTLALDGVCAYATDLSENPRFLPLPPSDADEVARVLSGSARRTHGLHGKRADLDDEDTLTRSEPPLAQLAPSIQSKSQHSGWIRLGDSVNS
jgi:hypothetical protein